MPSFMSNAFISCYFSPQASTARNVYKEVSKMNMGKFLLGNIIGTAFIALLGWLIGLFVSWIAGFIFPESITQVIPIVVLVLSLLGVPRIWASNWNRMKLEQFLNDESED